MPYKCIKTCRLLRSSGPEGNVMQNVKKGEVEKNVIPIARHFFQVTGADVAVDAKDRARIKSVLKDRGVECRANATTAQAAKILSRDNKGRGLAFDSEEVDKKSAAAKGAPSADDARKVEIRARLKELDEPNPHHALGVDKLEDILKAAEEKAAGGDGE